MAARPTQPTADIPTVASTCDDARRWVRQAQHAGQRVGVVMTMGALHRGHLSLVQACQRDCDACVVTIFVNPTQFGPGEDFARYPRDLQADLALLAAENVNMVFVPQRAEMFASGHSTFVQPPKVSQEFEGQYRPDHFQGVATIVLKLLHAIPADVAFFGHKDYQQAVVIQHMVRDLNVDVDVAICPTVRDTDGLALSSRNRYLSPKERQQALAISRSLQEAAQRVKEGESDAEQLCSQIRNSIREAGMQLIDYVAIVEPSSLRSLSEINSAAIALVAAHVGNTRLIDNWVLLPKPPA